MVKWKTAYLGTSAILKFGISVFIGFQRSTDAESETRNIATSGRTRESAPNAQRFFEIIVQIECLQYIIYKKVWCIKKKLTKVLIQKI